MRLQFAHDELVPQVDAVRHQADEREDVAGEQPADDTGARAAENGWKQKEKPEQAVEDLAGDVGARAADGERVRRRARPCVATSQNMNAATTQENRSAPGFVSQRSTFGIAPVCAT